MKKRENRDNCGLPNLADYNSVIEPLTSIKILLEMFPNEFLQFFCFAFIEAVLSMQLSNHR